MTLSGSIPRIPIPAASPFAGSIGRNIIIPFTISRASTSTRMPSFRRTTADTASITLGMS